MLFQEAPVLLVQKTLKPVSFNYLKGTYEVNIDLFKLLLRRKLQLETYQGISWISRESNLSWGSEVCSKNFSQIDEHRNVSGKNRVSKCDHYTKRYEYLNSDRANQL